MRPITFGRLVSFALLSMLVLAIPASAWGGASPQAPARTAVAAKVRAADGSDPGDDLAGGATDLTNHLPRYASGDLRWGVGPYQIDREISYVTIGTANADVDWYKFKITPDEYDNSGLSYLVDTFSRDPNLFTVIDVYVQPEAGGVPAYTVPSGIDTPNRIDSLADTGTVGSPWSYFKGEVVVRPHEIIGTPSIASNYWVYIRVRPWINPVTHLYDVTSPGPYTLRVKAGAATRLSGTDRFDGAIKIGHERWETFPEKSQDMTVTLANGLLFPDALSGAGLCGSAGMDGHGQRGGPLLLTRQDHLSYGVAAEIKRVGAKGVYVLGGPVSVSNHVIADLQSQVPGIHVKRIGGADRYEVAANVGTEMKRLQGGALAKRFAFVACGSKFPDALACTPMAYFQRVPILLTNTAFVPNATKNAITNLGITDVVIAGGPASVSSDVANWLGTRLGGAWHVWQIGGANRYAVARSLATWATDQTGPGAHNDNAVGTSGNPTMLNALGYSSIGVASGENFSDALAAGPMCGHSAAPLLLTPRTGFSPYIKAPDDPDIPAGGQYVDIAGRGPILRSYLFGGSASVNNFTFLSYDLETGW